MPSSKRNVLFLLWSFPTTRIILLFGLGVAANHHTEGQFLSGQNLNDKDMNRHSYATTTHLGAVDRPNNGVKNRDVPTNNTCNNPNSVNDDAKSISGSKGGDPSCRSDDDDDNNERVDNVDDEAPADDDDDDQEWYKELLLEQGTLGEIYHHYLECDKINPPHGSSKEIPDDAMWKVFRGTYSEVMKQNNNKLEEIPSDADDDDDDDSFMVSIDIQYSDEMGRGVYAGEFIPKGSPLYRTKHSVEFHTAALYRQYLFALPPKLACDAIAWSYPVRRQLEDDEEEQEAYMICMELDYGALTNDCSAYVEECNTMFTQDEADHQSTGTTKPRGVGCDHGVYYITQDLQKGEQILVDYRLFVTEGKGWEWLGLGANDGNVARDDDDDEKAQEEEENEKQWEKYLLAEGTLDEIYGVWLECDDLDPPAGPTSPLIPNGPIWATFRNTYQQILEEAGLQDSVPAVSPEQPSGFLVPIQVKYTEEIGRGVYAEAFISKGTAIYKTINAAEFHSAELYRKFLFALPPRMACEAMSWAYPVRRKNEGDDSEEEEESYVVCVDLDEGILTNDCNDIPEECNTMIPQQQQQQGQYQNRAGACDHGVYYATRDIQEGEQILSDYSLFPAHENNGWESLGLKPSDAEE